jgi:hypothetical protein
LFVNLVVCVVDIFRIGISFFKKGQKSTLRENFCLEGMSLGVSSVAICVLMMVIASTAGCNISQCIDASGGLATTPAMQPYYNCLSNASGTLAFACRCTLRIADCLKRADGGNCTNTSSSWLAFEACGQFLVSQNLGCSNTLCVSSAANTASWVAMVVTLMFSLLTIVM